MVFRLPRRWLFSDRKRRPPPPARWFRSIIRLPPIIFALGRQLKWWEPGQCFGFWIISSVLLCQGLYSVTLWLFIRADTLTHSHAIRRTHTHTRKTKIFSIWAFPLVVKLLWTHQMFKVQQNQLKLAHRLYALLYHLQTRTVQSKRYPEEVLTTCSATEERFMCWLLRFVGLPLTKCAFPAKSFHSSTGGSGVPRNLATRQQKQSRGRAGAGTHGGETTQGLKRSRNQLCWMFVRAHRQNVSWREEPTGDRSRRSVSVRARLQMENTRAYILFFYIRVRRTMTFHGHLRWTRL